MTIDKSIGAINEIISQVKNKHQQRQQYQETNIYNREEEGEKKNKKTTTKSGRKVGGFLSVV